MITGLAPVIRFDGVFIVIYLASALANLISLWRRARAPWDSNPASQGTVNQVFITSSRFNKSSQIRKVFGKPRRLRALIHEHALIETIGLRLHGITEPFATLLDQHRRPDAVDCFYITDK